MFPELYMIFLLKKASLNTSQICRLIWNCLKVSQVSFNISFQSVEKYLNVVLQDKDDNTF